MRKSLLLFIVLLINNFLHSQIIVTEINYNSDSTTSSGNWFEIYNNSSSNVDLTNWQATDFSNNFFTFPSISLQAGRYLVVSDDTIKFKSVYTSVSNVVGNMPFGLSNNSDAITILDDNGVTVFTMVYHDSLPFPKGADSYGRTLELRTLTSNPNLGTSWFDGCMMGSPGTAYQPCNDAIIFSEINYNSGTTIASGDWIELFNKTASSINLGGYVLKDDKDTNSFVFPNPTILNAGGYLVVSGDTTAFKFFYPSVQNFLGQLSFGFGKGGDVIRLYKPQSMGGQLQYSVVYDDTLTWPLEADGGDKTLELLNYNGIMDDGNNWFAGCVGGSPGQAYNPACVLSVTENVSLPSVHVKYMENGTILFSCDNTDMHYQLFDLQGRLLDKGRTDNKQYITASDLKAGSYVLLFESDGNKTVVRFVR